MNEERNVENNRKLSAKQRFDRLILEELRIIEQIRQQELKLEKESSSRLLQSVNRYPFYGSYSYGGSLPYSQILVNPSSPVEANEVWKSEPFVIPGKMKMFQLLTQTTAK